MKHPLRPLILCTLLAVSGGAWAQMTPSQLETMQQYGLDCNIRYDRCGDSSASPNPNAGKPPVGTVSPRLTDMPGTTFAYNIKDGSWWVKYDTYLAGGDARATCDRDSKKRYGNFWCNHRTKKGTGRMVVAMGFDTQEGRYRITHNADRSGSPDTVLQACQAKGYADCHIAYDGQ